MQDERSAHRSFASLVSVFALLAVVCLALSWLVQPPAISAAFLVLLAAVLVSENFPLSIGPGVVTLGLPLTMAAVILLGPTSAALVGASAATSYAELRRGKSSLEIIYNLSSLVLVTLAAGWAYLATGGRLLFSYESRVFVPLNGSDFPGIVLPLLVAAVVCVVGNILLICLGVSVKSASQFRSVLAKARWIAPNELALAFVGFFIAQVLAISVLGLVLFIAPLVVARQAYQRYVQLREAYADTVRSLVGVLEAKDPYTRGHSERVAGYALAIGRKRGLREGVLERLEYAALLHDLGKIAITRAILVKPGRLTAEEYAAVREHPGKGADIVARIPSLADIVPGVRHHHEWFNGNGYCDGIIGSDIPELARILAVADAFDAMTTARPYRPARDPGDAVGELLRMSGQQFDPEVVTAFVESGGAFLYSPHEAVTRVVYGEVDSRG